MISDKPKDSLKLSAFLPVPQINWGHDIEFDERVVGDESFSVSSLYSPPDSESSSPPLSLLPSSRGDSRFKLTLCLKFSNTSVSPSVSNTLFAPR
eukprot:CAMPEP_0204625210 /NCGR_PEP_ID=MMETSP0717-20131115/10972_1 /ASSEMBLY_ACC=CAM_ASM_000666 /TAXON_ID=230516 /ORGANISM="Chaetoceros curvisetus" /LENGTH=94 /DNA_ID=CAMNT_0051640861 /DNA_START=233 /DNA_END=517 /DNA_ORIENTATION=-